MTKMPYEFTPEMRDFAEKSVEQARKAFESVIATAQKAVGSVDGAASTVHSSAKEFSGKTVSFAEANATAVFDLAQKLVHAKDLQEVLGLQSEFVKKQFEAIQEQAKEMGETVKKAITQK